MVVGGGEEDFRRQTAGSGDISCCRGRGGRRSGNGKVDDGADEADSVRWTMMAVKEIWGGGQASR